MRERGSGGSGDETKARQGIAECDKSVVPEYCRVWQSAANYGRVCLGVAEYGIVQPHSQSPCLVAVYGRVSTCHLEVLWIHRESVVTDTVQSRRKNLKVSHT